jgi:DNA-binding FadR family transcriptional regulator
VLVPGALLPGEHELAEHAGISRLTSRQVLADPSMGNDIVARHAAGTFVAELKLTHAARSTWKPGSPEYALG